MSKIVKAWGLDDRIAKIFEEHEIDERILPKLDSATIKELIPLVGLRVQFLEKWKEAYGQPTEPLIDKESNAGTATDDCSTAETNSNDEYQLVRQDAFMNETSFQLRMKTLSIRKILSKSLQGLGILKAYQKDKKLSKKSRNKIVDIILSHILTEVECLKNSDLEFLAKKIVDQFPTEDPHTYYIAPIPKRLSRNKDKSITSRGKLVDKYRNTRKQYKTLTGCRVAKHIHDSGAGLIDERAADSEDIRDAVIWLGKHTAPWEDVTEKWETTREYRRQELASIKDAKVCTIYDRWPILKQPMGYTLIESDYASMNLSVVQNNYDRWFTFFEKVEKVCERKTDDSNADALYDLLQLENLMDDAKVIIQLLLLPHLLPPKGRSKRNKKDWKPSINECKDSIIVHVVLSGDVIRIQEDRVAAMQRLGLTVNHLSIQFIIVLGPNLTEFTRFYVSVDKVLYSVSTALEALDICFKTFHVLNAEYPIESEHLWLLIQKGLYNFTTLWDKSISYVSETLGMMSD